jgi:hypothetical protein
MPQEPSSHAFCTKSLEMGIPLLLDIGQRLKKEVCLFSLGDVLRPCRWFNVLSGVLVDEKPRIFPRNKASHAGNGWAKRYDFACVKRSCLKRPLLLVLVPLV